MSTNLPQLDLKGTGAWFVILRSIKEDIHGSEHGFNENKNNGSVVTNEVFTFGVN